MSKEGLSLVVEHAVGEGKASVVECNQTLVFTSVSRPLHYHWHETCLLYIVDVILPSVSWVPERLTYYGNVDMC